MTRVYDQLVPCTGCARSCEMKSVELDADVYSGMYDARDRPWCEDCAAAIIAFHDGKVPPPPRAEHVVRIWVSAGAFSVHCAERGCPGHGSPIKQGVCYPTGAMPPRFVTGWGFAETAKAT